MKNGKYFTVREAAIRLGCTLKYIYDLTYAGKLKAEKIGGRWSISRSSVEARLKQRGR